ncbi:MAG: cytochrome family protein [Xanthobacteraceae bacterium]|jgi:hypothetical protein
MNKRFALVAGLAMACLIVAPHAGLAQGAPPDAAPVPYALTMGDMMNALVQPRHAKLGLAGRAANWPLAGYALVEIRQTFASIVKAQPRFRGLPVGELAEAALGEPMRAVDAAIKQRDPQKFTAAYDQLTQGCNACHATLDHPFVVIKSPDASAFSDQEFTAPR